MIRKFWILLFFMIVISISSGCYLIAHWGDSSSSSSSSSIAGGIVETPIFSVPAGTYSLDQTITISCSNSNATIYYTLDGSTPTPSSSVYSNPISISGNGTSKTIKAYAVKTGMIDSTIASATYIINYNQVSTPQFNPAGGTFSSDLNVTISCATSNVTIYYTTDGSAPTTSSSVYSSTIPVSGNGTTKTIKTFAIKTGMTNSTVASASYIINYSQVSTPQFTPGGGTYTSYQSVTISCATSGATIRYTTDGSTPSETVGTIYSSTVAISPPLTFPCTLKAIAYKSSMSDSAVSSAVYTILIIKTVAGTAGVGAGSSGDGGPATSAKLNDPVGVAIDPAGNIYIADAQNSRIRKVDHTTGNISTFAGSGLTLGDGGLATSAKLSNPYNVAIDSAGNIYIADELNQRIRKVDTSGIISTIAGTGTGGYSGDGGLATSAQLNNPSGVVFDTAGNLYIADSANYCIRKIDHTTGNITTVAGTGGFFRILW